MTEPALPLAAAGYAPAECPPWCNAHEASTYSDVTEQEHQHVGRHRFALPAAGHVDLTITWYVSMFDADGVTVSPITDDPFVNIDVQGGGYASEFQGPAATLAIVVAAVTAMLNGLTPAATE